MKESGQAMRLWPQTPNPSGSAFGENRGFLLVEAPPQSPANTKVF